MPFSDDAYSLLYLWSQRTIYIGAMFELSCFTPAASALVISMEKPLRIRSAASPDFITTRSALIPAGVSVEVEDTDQLMACCYLDALGRDLAAFKTLMQRQVGNLWIDSRIERQQIASYELIYRTRMPAAQTYKTLLESIFPPAAVCNAVPGARAEIARAVEIIRCDPVSNPSNLQLAQQVGLTEAQLQRQFKQITGIPIRRYRLWHRLFVTATLMMLGKTLTDAALEAGFSDSSHFNHAFRSILGMKPSFIFQRRDRIFIYAGGDVEAGKG